MENEIEMNEADQDKDLSEKDIDSNNENEIEMKEPAEQDEESSEKDTGLNNENDIEMNQSEQDEENSSEKDLDLNNENDDDAEEKQQTTYSDDSDDSDNDDDQPKQKFLRKRKPKDESNEDSDVQVLKPNKKKQKRQNKSDSDVEEVQSDAAEIDPDSDFEDDQPKRSSRRTKAKKKQKRQNKSDSDVGEVQPDAADINSNSDLEDTKPKRSSRQTKVMKKQKRQNESDSDFEEVQPDAAEMDSDTQPKRSSRRTKAKKKESEKKAKTNKKEAGGSDSDDSDVRTKSSRRRRRKQSDSSFEEISSDDSDDEIRHTIASDSDESSDASIIITRKKNMKDKGKKKVKKGRGKKKKKNDEDEEEDEDSDEEGKSPTKGRRKIRKILKDNQLNEETRHARDLEEQRRQRLLERTAKDRKEYTKVLEISDGDYVLERNKEKQPLVSVCADINKHLKPHQRKGIQFMYDCCIDSVSGYKKGEEGGGCLLAHCMGLGKTLQIVSFTHTLEKSENINMKRFLIVAPLNTVLNWEQEFEKWLNVEERMDVFVMSRCNGMKDRIRTIKEWFEEGGALIIGYEMYRNLVNFTFVKGKKVKEQITKYLVDPGPDLVVCDEGHILRNSTSAISIAMNKVKTRRRIVLTGTPLQNNLPEYHVMVDFVKPNLLGTKKEFLNRFANPITNGRCSNSTPRDVKIMKQRCHVLYQLLSGCVQRQDYSVLTPFLPMKREYTIFVRMQEKQIKIYKHYLENFVYQDAMNKLKGSSLFSDFHCLSRIWCHPWSLHLERLRRLARQKSPDSMEEFLDDNEDSSASESDNGKKPWDENTDSEEENETKRRKRRKKFDSSEEESASEAEDEKPTMVAPPTTSARATRASRRAVVNLDGAESNEDSNSTTDADVKQRGSLRSGVNFKDGNLNEEYNKEKEYEERKTANEFNEWYDEFLTQEDETNVELSGKLVIMLEIIANAEVVGDKILVFTQSLASLDLIESALGGGSIGGNQLNWCHGIDYFRMDGSTPVQRRKRWSDTFNDPDNEKCRLFLISTKAGSLGINMVGANRVIIFDCSWNPSHDVQSVFRVYRFGQEKPVYVYRLIAQGTMEEKVYDRQITKLAVASRVVDEMQIERHFTHEEIRELYSFRPEAIGPNPETPQLPKDPLLAEVLQRKHPTYIVRYHEHDLLLENVRDEEMSEEEKKQAWSSYEEEKNMAASRLQNRQYMQAAVNGGPESFQQMMASQQEMVEKRMQQVYNPETGARYNIVIPQNLNLSPSEQALYEAAVRRSIISKFGGASASGGGLPNTRLPSVAGAQPGYTQLPANRIVRVQTSAPQQGYRFHNVNPPPHRYNNGPSSIVRVISPNDTSRPQPRPPLDPSKFPPPPMNNLN